MFHSAILSPAAILIATIASAALGAAWYSPLLFGGAWLREIGKSQEQLGSPTPAMIGSVLSCLVAATAVDFLVATTGVASVTSGVVIGMIVGAGIVATAILSVSLFSGWSWRLYFIQAGYRVTYVALMGAISGGLRG